MINGTQVPEESDITDRFQENSTILIFTQVEYQSVHKSSVILGKGNEKHNSFAHVSVSASRKLRRLCKLTMNIICFKLLHYKNTRAYFY